MVLIMTSEQTSVHSSAKPLSLLMMLNPAGNSSKLTSSGCILQLQLPLSLSINYLEATWLYSAKYLRTMWNMYRSVKDVDPRTNNVSEGSNNSINTAAGCSHPRICHFIEILQKYNAEQETRFIQFDSEMGDPRRRKSSHTRDRDERISKIVDSYDGLNPLSSSKFFRNRLYSCF